ncbi:MAG: peptidylprolyl isomerase [Chthonomonadales bacterium]
MSLKFASVLAMMVVAVPFTALARPIVEDKNPIVTLKIKDKGDITLELYVKEAPKTVEHFTDLVSKKFYDGIIFHRVIPGFVAQGGDPASKKLKDADIKGKTDRDFAGMGLGTGGSGKNIPFEANKLTNETMTVAMALSGPRSATGDSQFFINLVPNHRLDGDYCVFGKVIKGADVVAKLVSGDRITSARIEPEKKKKK